MSVVKWSEVKLLSRIRLFATPWTVAYQASPSMGFSRKEYWSELPFPSPGDLPDPGIEPGSPTFQTDPLTSEPPGKPYDWLLCWSSVQFSSVTLSCPTLCDPMDCTVHRILQFRILEWVNFPFSRGSSQPRDRTQVFHIAGGFFTSWATRGSQKNRKWLISKKYYQWIFRMLQAL